MFIGSLASFGLRRKRTRTNNIISVIRIYPLYLHTVLITAGPASQYRMQVSKIHILSLESKHLET